MAHQDLLFSLLTLDSYNQGYRSGIVGIAEPETGDAEKILDSAVLVDENGRRDLGAGFYAVAYKLPDGRIVISYRGTDNPGVPGTQY